MRLVDYIVVGQGIAGSCLALELLKRDKKFVLIDSPDSNSASRVAAGLFNPITGRTNQPTWRAAELFETLFKFYDDAEKQLQTKFLFQLPIYRPFISSLEQMKWPSESNAWISQSFSSSQYPEFLHDPFGGIEICKSGFVDTTMVLAQVRQLLQMDGTLLDEQFDFGELTVNNSVQYKNIIASRIVFCEGTRMELNPWFKWLPLRKLKGELLIIKGALPPDKIVNRGIFCVPLGNQSEFLIGSTYRHDLSLGNTPTGTEEIMAKAEKLFKNPLNVIGQLWGHRPTTVDRRPFLGHHPTHKNICIFNGLGTKGVSLAPFFAVHLMDWLEGKSELDKEVNIERFYSLYFKSN